jgi:hypothetical protein
MKIRPVGAELFHPDGQTDITKLIVIFRNFCERAYKLTADSTVIFLWHGPPNFL